MRPWTVEAGGGDGQQDPHLNVVIGEGLAREPDLPQEVALLEHVELGPGHLLGLALQVLYPAGRAPGVGAAAVQDIHTRVLLYRQDQSLVLRNIEGPYALDL